MTVRRVPPRRPASCLPSFASRPSLPLLRFPFSLPPSAARTAPSVLHFQAASPPRRAPLADHALPFPSTPLAPLAPLGIRPSLPGGLATSPRPARRPRAVPLPPHRSHHSASVLHFQATSPPHRAPLADHALCLCLHTTRTTRHPSFTSKRPRHLTAPSPPRRAPSPPHRAPCLRNALSFPPHLLTARLTCHRLLNSARPARASPHRHSHRAHCTRLSVSPPCPPTPPLHRGTSCSFAFRISSLASRASADLLQVAFRSHESSRPCFTRIPDPYVPAAGTASPLDFSISRLMTCQRSPSSRHGSCAPPSNSSHPFNERVHMYADPHWFPRLTSMRHSPSTRHSLRAIHQLRWIFASFCE
jgi:hypothetical protein